MMRAKHFAWIVMIAPLLLLSGASQGVPQRVPQRSAAGDTPTRGPDVTVSPVSGFTVTPVPPGMGDDETLMIPRKGQDYDFPVQFQNYR